MESTSSSALAHPMSTGVAPVTSMEVCTKIGYVLVDAPSEHKVAESGMTLARASVPGRRGREDGDADAAGEGLLSDATDTEGDGDGDAEGDGDVDGEDDGEGEVDGVGLGLGLAGVNCTM